MKEIQGSPDPNYSIEDNTFREQDMVDLKIESHAMRRCLARIYYSQG